LLRKDDFGEQNAKAEGEVGGALEGEKAWETLTTCPCTQWYSIIYNLPYSSVILNAGHMYIQCWLHDIVVK